MQDCGETSYALKRKKIGLKLGLGSWKFNKNKQAKLQIYCKLIFEPYCKQIIASGSSLLLKPFLNETSFYPKISRGFRALKSNTCNRLLQNLAQTNILIISKLFFKFQEARPNCSQVIRQKSKTKTVPISSRVDKASATETVESSSRLDQTKDNKNCYSQLPCLTFSN